MGAAIRVEAKSQRVEIGVEYDGAERAVFSIDPDRLVEIAREAADWRGTVYFKRATCTHMDCAWEGKDGRDGDPA